MTDNKTLDEIITALNKATCGLAELAKSTKSKKLSKFAADAFVIVSRIQKEAEHVPEDFDGPWPGSDSVWQKNEDSLNE